MPEVGLDKYAESVKNLLEADSVLPLLSVEPGHRTGVLRGVSLHRRFSFAFFAILQTTRPLYIFFKNFDCCRNNLERRVFQKTTIPSILSTFTTRPGLIGFKNRESLIWFKNYMTACLCAFAARILA